MAVGLGVTKGEIDMRAGNIAQSFQRGFEDVATLQAFFQQTPNADLIALGYTDQEVATLKTAYADLSQLGTIWTGSAALPAAKDFRQFARQLWGIGAF